MPSPDLTHTPGIIYPPAADTAAAALDTAAEAHLAHTAATQPPAAAGHPDLIWASEENRDVLDR